MMGVGGLSVALEWFGRIESSLRALLTVQVTEQAALEYAERITCDDLETFQQVRQGLQYRPAGLRA